jgi:uncharacterized glyoxalase superfamily protein PhnB
MQVQPYLFFDGRCEEAIEFYRRALGAEVIMDGKHNFMMKAMSLFMNMDKMIGTDFEQGLANLNTAAQSGMPTTV